MKETISRGKTAIVVYRKNVYRVSPAALQAMMELTRRSIDSDLATGFVLRQEGYDVTVESLNGINS